MKIAQQIIIPCLLLLTGMACSPINPPQRDKKLYADSVMVSYKLTHYGQYYPELECDVWSLDLYSEGITFDSAGHMAGTGYNLYLSDIFMPIDSQRVRLDEHTYTLDSLGHPYTALTGMNFEGNITGSYLLALKDGKLETIYLFEFGMFEVIHIGDTTDLRFSLLTTDDRPYSAHYRGILKANCF